ncbi:MAG: GNAT family N-acetyltransferase [Microbacterium sp. SCN 70-200]|uniref:GNAT family N-acetyltransferase n=1 Tax=unclassified Microbacterium TaxID=2609290 RepID=UPI00086DACCD|nr:MULTISPECIES: GNAT family N-acetyltransferase [unclassified Microbacterium]MBN9213794.1 GNAT family N-acetyltransferase [Microbacterium sp.]ODT42353.1 MAG: GNAT family N-acetyltransferase [Microbacterium sp. SCN 70-200]OJV85519.1 MAG: GNAT family N-acetyltransferase [Microbacterium sp. 70-16]
MEPVTLTTTRLELSAPRESDIDEIYEACQDADTQRYTTVPSPYARAHAEEFVPRVAAQWAEGVHLTWAMREGPDLAGMIGLYRLDGTGAGEIGYWVSPWSRRRGLLVEAARRVIDWGFSAEGTGLQRIEWRAVVGNVGSARAARALGFRYEGLLRAGLPSKQGRDDGWIAGLLADDDRTPQAWPIL